jgi:hypothetical protein
LTSVKLRLASRFYAPLASASPNRASVNPGIPRKTSARRTIQSFFLSTRQVSDSSQPLLSELLDFLMPAGPVL